MKQEMQKEMQKGIQPFWFWNGEMEESEIRRQIREMHEKGLKGFLIHPRQGMEIPYLSEVFFERVRTAVETAREYGMEVWLYDEFPYPSGVSGGKVLLDHPEYTCKRLDQTCTTASGGEIVRMRMPWGNVISAKAYPVKAGKCQWELAIDLEDKIGVGYGQDVFQMSGLTQYNKKRFFRGDLEQHLYWRAPAGEWKIYVYTEVALAHFKYFESFVDPLNPAAVRYFLETTHEVYKRYVGDEFGKTIKGFFTDEVTAFPPGRPWSVLLPGLVMEKTGLDLIRYLPALTEDMGEITAQVRYAYHNVVTEQFIESWDKQVYRWCEENGLLYIGEKPILRSEELKYVHVPGTDAGHQKFGARPVLAHDRYRSNSKIVASAAHFYNKPAALCEAFHSIGWGMTMQDAKWIFDWLAVQGVDWFITHGAYYTTDGLKKHDAPPSFFEQMPWWQEAAELTAYVDKLQGFLQENERSVRVLLVDPVTSTWTCTGEQGKRLREDFAAFQNALLYAGVDYYVIDPRLFAQGKVEPEVYRIGKDAYGMIVLPYMTNLEEDAVRKLEEYVNAGGKLMAVGTLPREALTQYRYESRVAAWFGADPRQINEAYFSACPQPATGMANCRYYEDFLYASAVLATYIDRESPWKVEAETSNSILQIRSVAPDGEHKLFLTNTKAQPVKVRIAFRCEACERTLAAGESLFFSQGDVSVVKDPDPVIVIDPAGSARLKPLGRNVLRMGRWEMEMPDGQKGYADSLPMIDQLEQAGIKIQVLQKPYFGCPKELDFPKAEPVLRYHFTNRLAAGERLDLVMEPGTLSGNWSIQLNGHLLTEKDFVPKEVYMHSNLAADVTDLVCAGRNELLLQLCAERSFDGIRNPLYLCGDFAVHGQEDGEVLVSYGGEGNLMNIREAGLPYYSGAVDWTIPAAELGDVPATGDSPVILAVENPDFRNTLALYVDGERVECCMCSPYRFRVAASKLREAGELTFRMYTAMSELFEGEYFEERKHEYVPVLLQE